MAQQNKPNMNLPVNNLESQLRNEGYVRISTIQRGSNRMIVGYLPSDEGATGENPRQQRAIQEDQRILELEATNAELLKEKERLEIENERLKTENEHLKTENERCVNELSERLKNQHLEDMEQHQPQENYQ